jgi:hypothetical protein
MSPLLRAWACASVTAALLVGTFPTASAQTGAKAPTCMTLLTADELTKAVGTKFEDMGGEEKGGGESTCPWMLRGGGTFKTVNVQFYTLKYAQDSSFKTLDGWFEQVVSSTEGVSTKKREMLPGIGQKTAFVAADPQVLAVVQRPDGVARIVGNNLTKAQITAVARAVAAP